MTVLWIAAAVLVLVTAALLGLPLLRARGGEAASRADYDLTVYKDQLAEIDRDLERGLLSAEQAEAARIEVQRRMLAAAPEDGAPPAAVPAGGRRWATAAVLCVAVPAAALGLYGYLGAPQQPDQPFAARPAPVHAEGRKTEMADLVAKLAARMEQNPDSVEGWLLLGRSYTTLGRFDDAAAAYGRVLDLRPGEVEVRADRAEALVMGADGRIPAQAREDFRAVLAADRANVRARFYLAMARAREGDDTGALQDLVDLIAISPRNAPWLPTVGQELMRLAAAAKVDPTALRPTAEALALAKDLAASRPAPPPRPQGEGSAPAAAAPGPSQADVDAASEMSAEDRTAMIRSMVQRLADRLEANPDDREGWLRLANAYRVLGETEKAKEAQARADALR
ncbi:MAG: c-type cytochrome biogenesis protein CcmI [Hyphomicrobiales bacterium]|nr:c-type cytochrome biogenesis protein CcmI [Hyphomicrobiales bacterium]MCP5371853.1 c-type cytochrome biogenesis protein CcmI [Hyphomicrobiales bacterium]